MRGELRRAGWGIGGGEQGSLDRLIASGFAALRSIVADLMCGSINPTDLFHRTG